MHEYLPILIVGAIIGVFTVIFLAAYFYVRSRKEQVFDRNMPDGEIVGRLLRYARPFWKNFVLVLVIMLFSIANEILSPLITGSIADMMDDDFAMKELFLRVGMYVFVLAVALVSSYWQAIILQRTGQKILSSLRESVFTHIESLSHEQLNQMPVGKLVTRVTNDTNAISMMFTNTLVQLVKNVFIIIGVLAAMLSLNYMLTLVILCFVPFVALFAFIFRNFSRRAYRKVKDGTTDINTYLSENLSGIKITQIFNREEQKMAEFCEKSKKLAKAKRNQLFVFSIFRPMVYMLYVSSVL